LTAFFANASLFHIPSREVPRVLLEIRARPELKPGTRLVREWQGRTYEVLVLDSVFSWQNTNHRSLSALARKTRPSLPDRADR
jgi:hypothetical protein